MLDEVHRRQTHGFLIPVQAHCAETLSSYKVPAHVELRTEPLPRNATGKIMKHVLSGEAENTFVEE